MTIDAQLHDTCTSLITQRRNVIKELIDTERIFTRDMRILRHIYKETADACPALDSEAIQLIFRNVDDIVSVHTSFQSELEMSAASVYNRYHEKPSVGNNNIPTTNVNRNTLIQVSEAEDRATWIGRAFMLNIDSIGYPDRKDLLEARERLNALLFRVNTTTKLFEATPRPAIDTYNESMAKPGVRRMLRKSMSRMRLWSHRLSGNDNRVNDHRSCSSPLDDGTDKRGPNAAHEMSSTTPFSLAKGDHEFPHTWYSSRSAPDLLTKTSK
ncbi:Dbl-domain-containing protein [Fusarium bulbicola]|nr:Dbl-domain-containing protein [Fusarium bulbicola]